MKIIRQCPFTEKLKSMELDVTKDQLQRWAHGELAQNVFPHLALCEREFIISGITPEVWDDTFGDEE